MSHSSHRVVPVDVDAELLSVQRLAFLVEASLIGSSAIPGLRDTLASLADARLDWFGVRDPAGLLGAVGITQRAGAIDIDRLVVAPRAFRRGIGTVLVQHVLAIADGEVTVSTGRANAPARALYERCGFVAQRDVEVEPALWVTEYRRQARLAATPPVRSSRPHPRGGPP